MKLLLLLLLAIAWGLSPQAVYAKPRGGRGKQGADEASDAVAGDGDPNDFEPDPSSQQQPMTSEAQQPSGEEGDLPRPKRSKRSAIAPKQPNVLVKPNAKPPKKAPYKPAPSDSDSDREVDDEFDDDLDWDDVAQAAADAAGPSTSAPAQPSRFERICAPLKFKAEQFEKKGHTHLVRPANEISKLHDMLAPVLRTIGDQDARRAFSDVEARRKLDEVAQAVAGAVGELFDRNQDLAMRSAAKERNLPEYAVVDITRSQYGSLNDLDPDLRASLKDSFKLVQATQYRNAQRSKPGQPYRNHHQYSQRSYSNPNGGSGQRFAHANHHGRGGSSFSRPRGNSPPPNKNPGRNSCNGYDLKYHNNDRSGGPGAGGFNPGSHRANDYRAPQHGSAYTNTGQRH